MKDCLKAVVIGLLFIAAVSAHGVARQEADRRLPVGLLVEKVEERMSFTGERLRDAIRVALWDKPIRLDDGAEMILYVQAHCVPLELSSGAELGEACHLRSELVRMLGGGPNPIGDRDSDIIYWSDSAFLIQSAESMQQKIVDTVVQHLNEPLAKWLGNSAEVQDCYLEQLGGRPRRGLGRC